MTIKRLNARLDYWLDRLQAPEWKNRIHLRWGGKREMRDAEGLCVWSAEYASADIALARKRDDHEETLVHELLHVVLQGHKGTCGEYDEMYERGLNRLAGALVSLERGE